MKVEFVRLNKAGKHSVELFVDDVLSDLDSTTSRLLTNTQNEYSQGIFNNNNITRFTVNNEHFDISLFKKLSYETTNEEFNAWIEKVKEIRNWADNVHSKNESVTFSAII